MAGRYYIAVCADARTQKTNSHRGGTYNLETQKVTAMPIPETQKALVLPAKCADYVTRSVPVPRPSPGQLLVKIHAAALNPIDWKIQKSGVFIADSDYPTVLGCDIAGTVEAVGVGAEGLSIGDRVCVAPSMLVAEPPDASGRGRISEGYPSIPNGAFQQYALVYADVTAKVRPVLRLANGFPSTHSCIPRSQRSSASTRLLQSLWGWARQPWDCSHRMSAQEGTSTVWA